MLVSCDSCEARYDYPDNKLGGRGAKFRCSRCSATVVVFPDQNVAIAADSEPTTEDWSDTLPDRESFVHPPGTIPPIQRGVSPFNSLDNAYPPAFAPPLSESALSVTPPPPRAIRQPHEPVAEFEGRSGASNSVDEVVRFGPPPRTGSTANPAPAVPGRFTHGGTPVRDAHPPTSYSPPTIPPYASYGAGATTASGAPNRATTTGPTGGPTPSRATYGSPYPQQGGHTDPGWSYGAPTPAPAPTGPPGGYPPMTVPPWASYGPPTWTQNPDPRQHVPTTYGAPHHTVPPYNTAAPYGYDPTTGRPAPYAYDPTTGRPVPLGTHTGAPATGRPMVAFDQNQPAQPAWAWMPIQNGLDRGSRISILVAVLVVGFVGACAGVGFGRLTDVLTTAAVDRARVPPPSRVMVEAPAPGQRVPVQGSSAFRVETEQPR